jgi:hypothetical protein
MEYDLIEYDCDIINNEIIFKNKDSKEEFRYELISYNSMIKENKIRLFLKEYEIMKDQLLKTDLSNSKILEVIINNDKYHFTSFKELNEELLSRHSVKKLKKISLYKNRIKDGDGIHSLYYIEKMNISYPNLCVNDYKKEILNLIEHLDMTIQLKIKLKNGKIIKYS